MKKHVLYAIAALSLLLSACDQIPLDIPLGNKILVIESKDRMAVESFSFLLPKDGLEIRFTVQGDFAFTKDAGRAQIAFNQSASSSGNQMQTVNFREIYANYAHQALLTAAKETFEPVSVVDIHKDKENFSAQLLSKLRTKLAQTPVDVEALTIVTVERQPASGKSPQNETLWESEINLCDAEKALGSIVDKIIPDPAKLKEFFDVLRN